MKLIIDLPDDAYEQVKETWTIYTQNYVVVSLYRAVKTAKPFEERPTGQWLHKEFDPFLKEYGQCSNCLQRERVGNFCRNCGADMRGEEE